MKKNKFIYIALCSIGFIACEPDFDQELADTPPPVSQSGEADFSNYIALGNSLTAGFADNALYRSGQENSFANIIANQMKPANGNQPFNTPFMTDDIGGFSGFEDRGFGTRLVFDVINRVPVPVSETANNDIAATVSGPFNNFGVPGIKSFQLGFPGLGNPAGVQTIPISANPYFARFASNPSASILGDALATNPTFFTLWLGNNDVLSYAVSGGTGINQRGNTDPTTYGPNDITDPSVFTEAYQSYITALTANGAKGVVTTIPDVSLLPFFRLVPFNPIPLDAETAAALNASFEAFNETIEASSIPENQKRFRMISFQAGQNAPLIIDDDLNPVGSLPLIRQAQGFDLFVLPSSSFIGTRAIEDDPTSVNGIGMPLADQWVLTSFELSIIRRATDAYNQTIRDIAESNENVVLYDANSRLNELPAFQNGITSQGLTVTSEFITGGAFSLDGIHLTPRGNAVIANDLINVINNGFESTLQPVQLIDFNTITRQ